MDVPILMLTAKSAESDRIRGLELGRGRLHDEAIQSPGNWCCGPKRYCAVDATPPAPTAPRTGTAELFIDEARHEVLVDHVPVDLTPTEWNLLLALATTPGSRVLPLRAHQPKPRVRVRGLSAHSAFSH